MARTFIGELILRLRDEMSGKARTAATNLNTSIGAIEKAAKRLNSAPWGGRFEEQLRKLGAQSTQLDKLRRSYNALVDDMNRRKLGKADRAAEIANFKTAALSHFGQIRHAWATNATAMEGRTRLMARRMESVLRPLMVALGGYTGVYMAGILGRGAVTASAQWEREKWRQDTASIPGPEKDKIIGESERLGSKYPSVDITNIAEMARVARAMMGDTDRALSVLPEMVRGMVALQSAKGTDMAVMQMNSLLRGIDNAGANKAGDLGIQATKDIIAGMIRAAQIENGDIDVGKFFQFARRGKISVPGLSTEFLANVQPALSQDMTAEGFGTALSSAYQAFVIGSNAVTNKANMARQKEIGIRNEDGLVQSDLFGTNPYEWVKSVLIPAFKKQNVDMENPTAIAKEVAQLTRNTNASGLITRMITQQIQIDRSIENYKKAMGPESAEDAYFRDPFVAYKGFIESLRNLSAAVGEDVMPGIVAGLNNLTSGINRFQQAWRDGDPMAKLGLAGAAGATAFGAWKVTSAIWGLITAGTSLNAAAISLQAAAVSLGAGGAAGNVAGANTGPGSKAGLMGLLGRLAPVASMFLLAGDKKDNSYVNAPAEERQRMRDRARRSVLGQPDVYGRATDYMTRRQAFERDTLPLSGNTPGLSGMFSQPVNEAKQAGQDIQSALNVSATPQVNTAQLREAVALANQLKAALAGIGGAVAAAHSAVARKMNSNFSDHGVTP